MQTKSGKQTIKCGVGSCHYNDSRDYCDLESIKVAPCAHAHSGSPEDESMCASYRKRQS